MDLCASFFFLGSVTDLVGEQLIGIPKRKVLVN